METLSLWQPATQPPPLLADQVHVWRIALDVGDALLMHLRTTLAEDERRRADRFHFEKDRRHFTAGRGTLRAVLAGYLQRRPEDVRFAYTSYGKPSLSPEEDAGDLRFNLSHSHGLALLAVTQGRDVGVDVELVRDNLERDGEALAERFFSPKEVSVLLSLPTTMRREAFFRCWTRKEAYIKAQGQGLSLPLDQFDVTLHPDEPAALLETRHHPPEVSRWKMRHLDPGGGYVGALAVVGHSWRTWLGEWSASQTTDPRSPLVE